MIHPRFDTGKAMPRKTKTIACRHLSLASVPASQFTSASVMYDRILKYWEITLAAQLDVPWLWVGNMKFKIQWLLTIMKLAESIVVSTIFEWHQKKEGWYWWVIQPYPNVSIQKKNFARPVVDWVNRDMEERPEDGHYSKNFLLL